MRKIKFRAWSKVFKKMAPENAEFHFDGDYSHLHFDVFDGNFNTDVWDFSECEIMQYTGLKDKNGVEIYEGDIVRSTRYIGGHYLDTLSDLVYIEFNKYEWVIQPVKARLTMPNSLSDLESDCEVIGNIHENKELLDN